MVCPGVSPAPTVAFVRSRGLCRAWGVCPDVRPAPSLAFTTFCQGHGVVHLDISPALLGFGHRNSAGAAP